MARTTAPKLLLGSTEQYSYLRLTVDCILPERVCGGGGRAARVPVLPVVAYGDATSRIPLVDLAGESRRISTSCATSSTAWRTAGFVAS